MSKKTEETFNSKETNFFRYWISDIGLYTVPSPEENQELVKQYLNGDHRAFEELLNRNKRLILNIAKSFSSDETILGELVQAGSIRLEKVCHYYDPSRGPFSNLATISIEQEMLDTLCKNISGFSMPVNIYKKIAKYKKLIANGITDEDVLIEMLKSNKSEFETIKNHKLYEVKSLNELVGEEANENEKFSTDNGETVYEEAETLTDNDLLHFFKTNLSMEQYYIFYERIYFKKATTQKAIGQSLGVERQRVSTKEKNILNRAKKLLSSNIIKHSTVPYNIKPVTPAHIINYLFIREYLTDLEKSIYKIKIFGEYNYSLIDYVKQFNLSLEEVRDVFRNLQTKLHMAKRHNNGVTYKTFYQQLITEHQSSIYKIDIDNFTIPECLPNLIEFEPKKTV